MNQNTNDTWIKLYRKLCDHEIIRDAISLQIFIWILLRVDFEKGSMICGRFWASEMLGTNPNTFYKALKRLEKKYDLVTLSSNNKNTTILVKNWKSYQQPGNTTGNNKVTTKEQQSNTNQEYKNIRNNIYKYNSIKSLTNEVLFEIAENHSITKNDVFAVKQKMENWLQAKGKKYKNYKAALNNWILKSIEDGRIKKIPTSGGRLASMIDERKNA